MVRFKRKQATTERTRGAFSCSWINYWLYLVLHFVTLLYCFHSYVNADTFIEYLSIVLVRMRLTHTAFVQKFPTR